MISEPLFIQVSTTPLYLLAVFVMLLLTMDLTLVRLLKLSDRAWKKVEYVWLGAAVLGLLGASTQGGRFVARNYLRTAESSLQRAYADLRATLRSGIDGMVCRSFQRSAASSEDLDTIGREYDKLCDSYKTLFARLPAELPALAPSLGELGLTLPKGERNIIGPYVDMLRSHEQWYEDIRRDVLRWRGQVEQGDLETTLVVVRPLAIAFAVALRITKVTGEIANARQRT